MTSEQRRVVLTLGFCGLVSAADNWFVSPALPAIAQTLAVAPSVVAVILTAYLVPYGALQPVCGAIGDRVGRVRLLRVIVAGLAVGTLVCALAVVAWLGVMRLRGVGEREADGAGAASGAGAFLSSAVRTFFGPGRAVFLIAFATGIIYLGIYGFMGTFLAERCGLSSTPAGLLMMFLAWRALRAEASLAGLAAGVACGELFWWVRPRGLLRRACFWFRPSPGLGCLRWWLPPAWGWDTSWCSPRLSRCPWTSTLRRRACARDSSALAYSWAAASAALWAGLPSPQVATRHSGLPLLWHWRSRRPSAGEFWRWRGLGRMPEAPLPTPRARRTRCGRPRRRR